MALLNFEDFKTEIVEAMKEMYSAENVQTTKVTKNNGLELTSLTVNVLATRAAVCPTIYLEHLYEEYERGTELEKIIKKTACTFEENSNYDEGIGDLIKKVLDFDAIKGFILPCLVNQEMNEKLLQTIPNRQFLDLSVVYKIHLDNDISNVGFILVKDHIMKAWGVTEEQLYETAMKNLQAVDCPLSIPNLIDMTDILMETAREYHGDTEEIDELSSAISGLEENMWVVTNRCKLYGASILLNSEYMRNLYKKFDKPMYIIPSSIHEIILTSEEGGSTEGLNEMITEVNSGHVQREEILSNHCYLLTGDGVTMCA